MCTNKRVIIACVMSGPCVVAFMGVPVAPDVDEVVLGDDRVETFNSALSGFRISAKLINLGVENRVEITPNDVVVGGKVRIKA